MPDLKLNFSSQWPSIQVVKVVRAPHLSATPADTYAGKVPHNLDYVPLVMGFRTGSNSHRDPMVGVDVDGTYMYIPNVYGDTPELEYVVVYAVDISQDYDYGKYSSSVGEVQKDDTGGALDLRKFLLHSRAVSPMLLSVKTKTYTSNDLNFTYTHPLNYPIFNFGYVRWNPDGSSSRAGIWQSAPLEAQGFPQLQTDGYTSTLQSLLIDGQPGVDKGSIITLRNPAITTTSRGTASI